MNEFYLNVDSLDRYSGNINNFNYQYTSKNVSLNQPYLCALKKLEFPSGCIYQINSTNNVFKYNIAGVNYTFTATPGNYTINELISQIQTHINTTVSTNSLATSITISYDVKQNKVGFIKTNNTLTAYIWGGDLLSGLNGMTKVLGLGTLDQIVLNNTTITYMPNQIDMSPLDYVFLRCSQIQSNSFVSGNVDGSDILYKIQLSGQRNSKIYLDDSNIQDNRLLIPRLQSNFNFYLTDRLGNFIEMNGIDYSFTLRLTKINP
jgi:hypothetical protein